ncbi:AraC family transcriptional regulator [Muricauda sp. SCSIO 64092]|uniref:helix-turn-helix domain-containing protein n=1 Tax=Allomuricauda sp. SCSIO 64092 TaxID=2908842 RepID=UPI001FF1C12D|nr:AraC family transcriptional regulator [Muricauda sp. SCSIO 64092]UOY06781.1 AraC family transcriptional regulator [Muricauda sp. SCSIO 64092]
MYKESIDAKPVLQEFNDVKRWLHLLMTSWVLLIGFLMIAIPIGLIFINQLDENSAWLYKSLGAIMAFWIYLLGYLYLTRHMGVIGKYMDKIGKFSFSVNELNEKKNEILHALQGQELYKDPNLTLAKLAGHLGWPINTLSTTINKTLKINFNDLINKNRIEAFKRLTLDPKSKKYSILGLGQEVGFSSKASFYRVFKKETGMTPSEYLKSKV